VPHGRGLHSLTPLAYTFGSFSLDPGEYRLTRNGQTLALSPRPFDLLVALVTHAGKLVTREELLREVWKDAAVEQSSLNAAMSVLRQALGDEAATLIETVPGRGYRFIGTIQGVTGAASPQVPKPPSPQNTPRAEVRVVILHHHSIRRPGVRPKGPHVRWVKRVRENGPAGATPNGPRLAHAGKKFLECGVFHWNFSRTTLDSWRVCWKRSRASPRSCAGSLAHCDMRSRILVFSAGDKSL